jgi:hypothetical protein
MTEKHYAHLAPSYVADTIRAHFPTLGITGDATVVTMKPRAETRRLDQLLSIAIGKSPPMGAGGARLSKRRGTKKGDVRNPAFHLFVSELLREAQEFGGTLELDKGRNFHESGGPLPDALTSLRPYVPERVFPDGKLDLSTLQIIKTQRITEDKKAALFEQYRELERDHVRRGLSQQVDAHPDANADDSARRTAERPSDQN